MDNVREIVNGAQLPRFTNKRVSLSGFVTEIAPNGMSFDVRAVDNVIVKVNLKRPLDKPLEGYVEVHGMANGKSITAENLIDFDSQDLDARGHNALCTFIYSIANPWATSD